MEPWPCIGFIYDAQEKLDTQNGIRKSQHAKQGVPKLASRKFLGEGEMQSQKDSKHNSRVVLKACPAAPVPPGVKHVQVEGARIELRITEL